MGFYSSFSYNKDHWWGLMCIYKSCIDDRITASLPSGKKVALPENQQTDPRGKKREKVDKQHPAHSQDKRAISEKCATLTMTAMHLLCEREYLHSNIGFMTGKLRCSAWKHLSAKLQQLHLWDGEEKTPHTSQVIMRTFLNVRPRRAFRTPEKCPSTCEGLIVWLLNISSIVLNKNHVQTGQVEINYTWLLRFHL